ncbi:MAG: hypothetical protein ABI634_05780 [Acidobacteriota bacterium]
MRLALGVAVAAVALAVLSGNAWAACPVPPGVEGVRPVTAETPGNSPIIDVPKGKGLRIMFTRPGTEGNYLEVCTRAGAGADWRMESGNFRTPSDWYFMWTNLPQPADWQVNFFDARVDAAYKQQPWAGMRRTATPTGFTLSYYGAAGPDKPNTIVEVCIYTKNIGECPAH